MLFKTSGDPVLILFFLIKAVMNIFHEIRKSDIILAAALILGCIISLAYFSVSSKELSPASTVVITKDGKILENCSIHDDKTVDTGSNTIVIKGGEVYMEHADCKNQICVREGKISHAGQSIVCMPNRVVVEIKGGDEAYDAITR